jgi:hypothetical protein
MNPARATPARRRTNKIPNINKSGILDFSVSKIVKSWNVNYRIQGHLIQNLEKTLGL